MLPYAMPVSVPRLRTLLFRTSRLALVASALPLMANAQPDAGRLADSLRRQIEAAVAVNDGPTLRRAREAAERASEAQPGDAWLAYYRGYAVFRETGFLLGAGRATEARQPLDRAVRVLEGSLDRAPSADALALLSALQGQRLTASGSTFTAMRLGPAVLRAIGRAEAAGPHNPRVWLLKGINAYNAPSAFGGGLERAEQYLRKALALYPGDRPLSPLPAWGLADTWIWLGRVLQAQGKRTEARSAYLAARDLQPQNTWVTGVLLPSLDAKGGD
jgi:tetratricopeptide (TPR) repeat protein